MKALILEDESAAAERLLRLLRTEAPTIRVAAVLEGVEAARQWLAENGEPDLLFLDIHLADGSGFQLFEEVPLRCPVIFTTAYDQYAIRAFSVNSVDYLLKPVEAEALRRALQKLHRQREEAATAAPERIRRLLETMAPKPRPAGRVRLLVRSGNQLRPLRCEEVACFFLRGESTCARDAAGKVHHLDQPLDKLVSELDPRQFFRVNRRIIVRAAAVEAVSPHPGHRLALALAPPHDEPVLVSRERAAAFRHWLDR